MTGLFIVLVVLLCLFVLIFEFINGFHDTANAVATVIYTRSMRPRLAVMWAGLWNVFGVVLGGTIVAMSIAHLLPLESLVSDDIVIKTAFFLSTLVAAILWNIYTWLKGIPCSSMHGLIGSVIGVSLGYALQGHITFSQIPRTKVWEVFGSLLLSPFLGFFISFGVVWLARKIFPKTHIFTQAPGKKAPPRNVRIVQILTCTAVSFAHGSNDGQKGIGMMMAILFVFLPQFFVLNEVPFWIIGTIGVVLGIGSMIGWKRIVTTIGEKIGKHSMTYGQGAVAETVAATTIGLSSIIGMPVSTTHVVSSGVAGAIAGTGKGFKELHGDTLKSMGIAWALTVPATVLLGFGLYFFAQLLIHL